MEVTGREEEVSSYKTTLKKGGCSKLNQKALDLILWITRFGRS